SPCKMLLGLHDASASGSDSPNRSSPDGSMYLSTPYAIGNKANVAQPGQPRRSSRCWTRPQRWLSRLWTDASTDLRIPFMESMKQSGIQTSIHYPPIHKFTGYKKFRTNDLPLTDHVTAAEVTLPLFSGMNPEQVEDVIGGVAKGFCH